MINDKNERYNMIKPLSLCIGYSKIQMLISWLSALFLGWISSSLPPKFRKIAFSQDCRRVSQLSCVTWWPFGCNEQTGSSGWRWRCPTHLHHCHSSRSTISTRKWTIPNWPTTFPFNKILNGIDFELEEFFQWIILLHSKQSPKSTYIIHDKSIL